MFWKGQKKLEKDVAAILSEIARGNVEVSVDLPDQRLSQAIRSLKALLSRLLTAGTDTRRQLGDAVSELNEAASKADQVAKEVSLALSGASERDRRAAERLKEMQATVKELEVAVSEVAKAAEHQAVLAGQLSQAMQAMQRSANDTTDNVTDAARTAEESAAMARSGAKNASEVVANIAKVAKRIRGLGTKFQELAGQTGRITELLPSGGELRFISTPFLHFPGAFVTYDTNSRLMFTSDIFAAIDSNWDLYVTDFDRHARSMLAFHTEYMCSQKAIQRFVESVDSLDIQAFLPQHGSILGREMVRPAIEWLRGVRCGMDLW